MTAEESNEYRREIIRRLEQEKASLNAEKARIDLETKHRRSELELALRRAYHPPLSNDICLRCWIDHGDKVILKNISEEPMHGMRDRFVCSKCSYEELREA